MSPAPAMPVIKLPSSAGYLPSDVATIALFGRFPFVVHTCSIGVLPCAILYAVIYTVLCLKLIGECKCSTAATNLHERPFKSVVYIT